MKKIGSVCEFNAERNRELVRAYFRTTPIEGEPDGMRRFQAAAESPASRFWVSERRAAEVVRGMMKGMSIAHMSRKRREMFMEIFRRTREYMERHPGVALEEAAFEAVNSPAPEFYLTAGSARVIIYNSVG